MPQLNDANQNPYASHVANLGESKEVIASEDIYNEQGGLLVKKGSPINKKMSERIIKFKLLKPIESSITIAQTINPKTLANDLNQTAIQIPELKIVQEELELGKLFSQLIKELMTFPLLVQKLTVMQSQLPELYQKTMHVTWFVTAIAKQMQLPGDTIINCFLASACHDIGMMHINPEIINKKESLTPEEWRQIQAHTVIAQKLLENVPQLNGNVAKFVLEHHERCDGSGYPVGKFSDQISQESQIIALSDSIVTVYFNKLAQVGKTLRDLIPFLQVNSESHFYANYTAVMALFRKLNLKSHSGLTDETIESAAAKIVAKNDKLTLRYQTAEEILSALNNNLNDKVLISASSVLAQLMKIVRGSGVLDPGYLRWIDQVKQEKLQVAYRELEDVNLMLEEIDWHLQRIFKMLNSFVDHSPKATTELKRTINDKLSILKDPNKLEEFAIT